MLRTRRSRRLGGASFAAEKRSTVERLGGVSFSV
jgi:hypothetical protein